MVDKDKKKIGPTMYRGDLSGHLVPVDSWYLGLALSLWIRWKALAVYKIWKLKLKKKKMAWKLVFENRKLGFQLGSANLVFLSLEFIKLKLLAVPAWNASGTWCTYDWYLGWSFIMFVFPVHWKVTNNLKRFLVIWIDGFVFFFCYNFFLKRSFQGSINMYFCFV